MSARLNVGHLDDNQPAVSDSDSLDQLVLSEADAIYVPIATFLVSLLAFAALAETYNGGTSKPWAADDNIVLDASAERYAGRTTSFALTWQVDYGARTGAGSGPAYPEQSEQTSESAPGWS